MKTPETLNSREPHSTLPGSGPIDRASLEGRLLVSLIHAAKDGYSEFLSIVSPGLFQDQVARHIYLELKAATERGATFSLGGGELDSKNEAQRYLTTLYRRYPPGEFFPIEGIPKVAARLLDSEDLADAHLPSPGAHTQPSPVGRGPLTRLFPAQDFVNGVLYYAVEFGDKQYLLTSKKELIPFHDCANQGFRLTTDAVDSARFSRAGIDGFLGGVHPPEAHEVYCQLSEYVHRYIFFKDPDVYDLVVVWIMGSYIYRGFDYYAYLHLNGEKGSGKSVLLDAIGCVAFNADLSVESSPAVIYREIERNGSTLLLDEVESMRKGDQEKNNVIMVILKSGFHRKGVVKRMGGKNFTKVEKFSTYSPKVLAGIRELDDVLQDRTIRIPMVRNTVSERRERFITSQANLGHQEKLRDNLYLFGLCSGPEIAAVYQEDRNTISGLDHLSGREYDIWAPLILLANAIDASREDGMATVTEALVRHSRRVFEERANDNERENDTVKLLQVLIQMLAEERPVNESNGVREYLTQRTWEYFKAQEEFEWMHTKTMLTRQLRRVEVRTKGIRYDGKTHKVYLINELAVRDLFCRYAPNIESVTETQTEIPSNV
jgi:hypothetical protein